MHTEDMIVPACAFFREEQDAPFLTDAKCISSPWMFSRLMRARF